MSVYGRPHQPKCPFCKMALYKSIHTFATLKNKMFSLCRNKKCEAYNINQQNLKNVLVSTSDNVEIHLQHFCVEEIHIDDVKEIISTFNGLEKKYSENVLYLLMFIFSKIVNNNKILNVILEEWNSTKAKENS